jgi:hypothetical protein
MDCCATRMCASCEKTSLATETKCVRIADDTLDTHVSAKLRKCARTHTNTLALIRCMLVSPNAERLKSPIEHIRIAVAVPYRISIRVGLPWHQCLRQERSIAMLRGSRLWTVNVSIPIGLVQAASWFTAREPPPAAAADGCLKTKRKAAALVNKQKDTRSQTCGKMRTDAGPFLWKNPSDSNRPTTDVSAVLGSTAGHSHRL